jgi:hypothetical protein
MRCEKAKTFTEENEADKDWEFLSSEVLSKL